MVPDNRMTWAAVVRFTRRFRIGRGYAESVDAPVSRNVAISRAVRHNGQKPVGAAVVNLGESRAIAGGGARQLSVTTLGHSGSAPVVTRLPADDSPGFPASWARSWLASVEIGQARTSVVASTTAREAIGPDSAVSHQTVLGAGDTVGAGHGDVPVRASRMAREPEPREMRTFGRDVERNSECRRRFTDRVAYAVEV